MAGGKTNYSNFNNVTCKDALRHILWYLQDSRKLGHCKTWDKTKKSQKEDAKQELANSDVPQDDTAILEKVS